MNILIAGSTGLIGAALTKRLTSAGHTVKGLRRQRVPGEPFWDITTGTVDLGDFSKVDAVINLAGENIAGGRWTSAKKQAILSSRVEGTQCLASFFSKQTEKPGVFACASAIGFYGNRGDESLSEESPVGTDFLSDVCEQWEDATKPLSDAGIRVANCRIGVVLSTDGGALKQMLLPFKMGVGGIVGSGRQYMSWTHIDDITGAFEYILTNDQLSGPVNVTAPTPVTNREFTKALGRALHRPTLFPLPAFMVKLLFGEMGDELLLSSTRVTSSKLSGSGYRFAHPEIGDALSALL
ncbi:TIGR01777 family protein [bacterium F16]|nr:TIGR01777 family protein [bacterium F16]